MIRKLLERWLILIVGWLKKMNNLYNNCLRITICHHSLLLYGHVCIWMTEEVAYVVYCLFGNYELILDCFSSSGFAIKIQFLLLPHNWSYAIFLCRNSLFICLIWTPVPFICNIHSETMRLKQIWINVYPTTMHVSKFVSKLYRQLKRNKTCF